MIEHASLQARLVTRTRLPPRPPHLAMTILAGETSVDDAIARAADHLLTIDRVEVVVTALTTFSAQRPDGLDRPRRPRLGTGVGTLRHVPSGSSRRRAPDPRQALSMPWLSQVGRRGVAVLTDRELLPPRRPRTATELEPSACRAWR